MARRVTTVRTPDGQPDAKACRRVLRRLSKATLANEVWAMWMMGRAPRDADELEGLFRHDREMRSIIAGQRVIASLNTLHKAAGTSARRFKRAERAFDRAVKARARAEARCKR